MSVPTVLSNSTRYLSAGAYIDAEFRDAVIDELLGDRHRAVAPSHGRTDARTVLMHCLRARRVTVARDAVISLLLLLGLGLDFGITAGLLISMVPLALLSRRSVQANTVLRVFMIVWAALVVLGLILQVMALLAFQALTSAFAVGAPAAALGVVRPGYVMLMFALLTAIAYWVFQYIQLSTTFDFGRPHTTPQESVPAQRDWYIDQAQWGNLALYGGEDPFVGSGETHQTWSIVVELDRKPPTPGAAAGERRNATIDPADLHAFIRERLEQMRTGVLNERESIARLTVSDHLTAPGTLHRGGGGHPLLGPDGMPRFTLDPASIDAVKRNPQGAMRYYQRVTVGAEGPPIVTDSGTLVVPSSDRETDISAYIHLAVEGRMMYTQCLIMALPPCRRSFHVIDVLPALSPIAVVGKALAALRLRLFEEVLFAPVRLVRSVFEQNRQQRPDRFLAYPYGARASVRELGAEREPTSFMQVLDIDKYSKLISQRLNEAVLDYLEAHDIDTTSYRQQAIVNYGAWVSGGTVNGPIAAGHQAQATQQGAS
ncbi:hypothetical protein [Herbidospora cretacea]|uniref:hypothetical protein n=1 Tax=Herbidospora cretacea TaxID=28444 RepID=UPI000774348B|nr:hypothetical protein [Herbidospora cretacea]